MDQVTEWMTGWKTERDLAEPHHAQIGQQRLAEMPHGCLVELNGRYADCFLWNGTGLGEDSVCRECPGKRVERVKARDPEAAGLAERLLKFEHNAVLDNLLRHVRSGRGIATRPRPRLVRVAV